MLFFDKKLNMKIVQYSTPFNMNNLYNNGHPFQGPVANYKDSNENKGKSFFLLVLFSVLV